MGHEEYFQSKGEKALIFSGLPRASCLRIVLACEQALQLRRVKQDVRERARSFLAPRTRSSIACGCRVASYNSPKWRACSKARIVLLRR